MRLQNLHLIRRQNGLFHHPTNGNTVKAYRPNSGIGVFAEFAVSPLDFDFQNLMCNKNFYWCPSVDELIRIQNKLDESDDKTFNILKTDWGGIRPRKIQLADLM
jgi:hypothetical protein